MPEGNFFADSREMALGPAGRAGEGRREAHAAPSAGVRRSAHAAAQAGPDAASAVRRAPASVAEYFSILRRRWWLVVGAPAVATVIAAGVIAHRPVRYCAEAELLLDTRPMQVSGLEPVVAPRAFDATMIHGEIAVLTSRTLAERVVNKLHLGDRADFGGTTQPGQVPATSAQRTKHAVDALLNSVKVQNDGRSFVLNIAVTAADPRLAADIANAYASLYLDEQVALKEDATRRATEWLARQIATLRSQIADAEQRIAEYKEAHGITSARGTTVTAQELADINSQLVAAHSDRIQKEAALRYARQVLGSADGAAAGQMLNSPLIQRLREQEVDLLRRVAEMSTRYRPEYPAMVRMQAELDDVRHKLAQEADRVVRGMAEEASAARNREEALKANFAELTQSAAQQEAGQSGLRDLESEAAANRARYDSLLTRFKQTSAQQDIQQPDAYVIARAEAPTRPAGPTSAQLIATPGLLSLFAAMLLAFAIEQFDPSFRRTEDVEELAGLSVLGILPTVSYRRSGTKPSERRDAALAEALRAVRSGLRHTQSGLPIGVLLVTSSGEKEGKTFFSIALGRSVVRARLRCLVMDCHFHHPGLAGLLAPASTPVLTPTRAAGRYPQIEIDKDSGLHYIQAPAPEQRRLFRSQDLFESAEMRDYIQRMRSHYDLIILDAPPVPAIADVVALSRLADSAIFLIRWGQTSRQTALGALRTLARRGAGIAGIVLSRVDLRRYASYGYADYVRYLKAPPAKASRAEAARAQPIREPKMAAPQAAE